VFFPASSFLLFIVSCLFASYPVFRSLLLEININELQKKRKHISRNIIVDKTITKRKKAKGKKQETGNKKHIVEQSLKSK